MLRGVVLCYALLAFATSAEVPLRGRVVDEQSRPIAGARVGLFAAFLPGADRAAVVIAADDGTFTFLAHPQQKHLLWVEADGFAPRLLDGIVAHAPAAIETIRLVRGASLSVSMDDADWGTSSQVQLVPRRVELGDHVTPEIARALWTRPAASRVQWPSLPPGEYELVIRRVGELPRSLLTVTLQRGEDRQERIALARQVPAEAPEQPLTIAVEEGEPRLDLQRAVVTRWRAGGREEIAAEQRRVSGRELTLRGGCIDGASYVIATPEAFAVTGVVTGRCREPLRVTPLPRANGTVRLQWSGREAPRHGAVLARGCGVSPNPPRPIADIPFVIDARGDAEILLPAGCVTPLLTVPRFAPIDLGTTRLGARQRHDFGTHALAVGASLLVRVVSRDDGTPLAGAAVLAFSPHELQQARVAEISLSAAKGRAVTNADGWARLTIGAGDAVLGVLRGNSRLPWLSDKYRGESGRETVVDPLEVPRPGSLTVRVDVAAELSEAGVRVERVVLQPGPDQRWPSRALLEAAPRDGIAVFDEVPPGRWLAFASMRMLDDPPVPTARVAVDVFDGFPTDIRLPVTGLLFRGRVVDPPATLGRSILLAPHDRAVRNVTATVDGHHRFVVLLEKAGLYSATMRLDKGETVVPRVSFEDPEREVEIHLPHGSIAGRVITADGNGVAGAVVTATVLEASSGGRPAQIDLTASAAGDGSFRFSRVAEGVWSLHARMRSAESERVAIDLSSGEVAGGVVLQVDETETATVRVLYENGAPVAGARVSVAAPPARIGDYGASHLVTTDGEGRFGFRASAEFRNHVLQFSVIAGDGTAASFRRALTDSLTLVLPMVTGQLILHLTEGEWPPKDRFAWLVAEDGSILGPRAGRVVAGEDGRRSRVIFPRLAPGVWRLVVTSALPEVHQLLTGNGQAVPAVGVARVAPGATAELTIRMPTKGGE